MKIRKYRGYELHLHEKVDIYFQGERIDTVASLADATQCVDNWLAAR